MYGKKLHKPSSQKLGKTVMQDQIDFYKDGMAKIVLQKMVWQKWYGKKWYGKNGKNYLRKSC